MKIKSFFKNIYKKRKDYFNNIKSFLVRNKHIFLLSLPFILMDIIVRLYGKNIGFYSVFRLVPNLFTITWIILFVGSCLCFKRKTGIFIYLFFILLSFLSFCVNIVYFKKTNNFFDFSLLESISEGSPYILDTLKSAGFLFYFLSFLLISLSIFVIRFIPKNNKNNSKVFIKVLIAFLLLHLLTPVFLGKKDKELTWSTWRNPKNVYLNFNDNNKSMKVSGLYEYTFRNFYITFLKSDEEINSDDIEFLNEVFSDSKNTKNKYSGIFKDKNVIFLQLEGFDSWVFSKNNTPTLYGMLNNSLNFTNHYSYYNGGGSTFNSEFAVNTGFITPLSYTKNAYSFNKNSFPNSLANIFKSMDYAVNAFHMNKGEYYSRFTNYANWGYDNYYGLIDMKDYDDESYKLDRELILNEDFSDLMFPSDKKFLDYIITYSPHMPFSSAPDSVCKILYDLDNKGKVVDESYFNEEVCALRQAKETDLMVKLLLNKLKKTGYYKDTVIVAFADHYLYTIENKTIFDKYKKESNNLINHTPLFIWSYDLEGENINKVTSQLNILPTVLNLFGIKYNPNNYIGEDALSSKYNPIVFFSDYSWYDGNVYVEGGNVSKGKISKESLEEKNYYISYITKKNDLALKYNYFKK